jgi:hypothetical protein
MGIEELSIDNFINLKKYNPSEDKIAQYSSLLTELVHLPTVKNLHEKIKISSEFTINPIGEEGCATYRYSLFLTAKGLQEIKTHQTYQNKKPLGSPSDLKIKDRIVPEDEFRSMAKSYYVDPEFLKELKSRLTAKEY